MPKKHSGPAWATRRRRTLALLPLLGAMTSCAPNLPELNVEPQWAQAMARLSMFGVYPAREDVMVGDLLLYVPRADGSGPRDGQIARFLTTRLASPPCWRLMEELSWQGRERPRLQPIPTAAAAEQVAPADAPRRAGTAGVAYGVQGDLCARNNRGDFEIGSSDDLVGTPAVRLQRGQVPMLTVARLTEGQLAGQGFFGGVGASLGLSGSGSAALKIELKNIELLRLDPPRISDMVRDLLIRDWRVRNAGGTPTPGAAARAAGAARHGYSPAAIASVADREHRFHPADMIRALDQRSTAARPLATLACSGDFAALARHGVRVLAVNDVMYARTITFSFSRSSAAAGRLAADLQEVLGLGRALPPPRPSGATPGGTAPPAPATADAAALAQERLKRLRELAGTPAGGDAAVRAEFAISSAGELSLNTTTARPVAVGFGAALEYAVEHAMVPTHQEQIREAKTVCATLVGQTMSERTERLLQANLAWVEDLANLTRRDFRSNVTEAPLGSDSAPSRHLFAPIFSQQR